MNLPELQKKLLAATRRHPPGDRVPYAFEKRVMARLAGATEPPPAAEWLAWSRALWLGAAACSLIAVATIVFTPGVGTNGDDSFSAGIEETIMASGDEFENW